MTWAEKAAALWARYEAARTPLAKKRLFERWHEASARADNEAFERLIEEAVPATSGAC